MRLQSARTIFQRQLTRAIALPSLFLLLFSGISQWQVSRLFSALQWVDHTHQVIGQAYQTQTLLEDLETGLRGYMLTGEQQFLEPYLKAKPTIDPTFQELSNLVSDNPSQERSIHQLISEYDNWKLLISLPLKRYQLGDEVSLLNLKARKQRIDAIRRHINDFIATEEQLLAQRNETVRETTIQLSVSSIILALGIGIILTSSIKQQIFKVSRSYEDALKTAIEQTQIVQYSAQRLADLHEIDRAILSTTPSNQIIQIALKRLRQLVNCQQAFLVLFDLETKTTQVIESGSDGVFQSAEGIALPMEDFAAIEVLQQRQIRLIQDIAQLEQRSPILEQMLAAGLHSCLTIPMQIQGALIGELYLVSTDVKAFSSENRQTACEVTEQLAIAIQQSQLRQQLQTYAEELEHRVLERTGQLQESNQDLEAFSYSISHDLRAPLRTIQGFAQALQEDYGSQLDSFGESYLNYINEGAMQMDGLITDLLSYSRLSRSEIEIQPVDLVVVVNEALKKLQEQIQERQAQITVDIPLVQVMAHYPTLIQALINLISNAIKFVQPGVLPLIHIYSQEYIQEDKSWIKLWVVDNGIGIAPEHQERIFQVFERLHGIEIYPGTGIGLAIIRKALEKMGGFSGVESQLGQGSRFFFSLPKVVLKNNYISS
ncbi:MAG: CHASE3 domain-containing protein [Nostoc sp. DedVER02]|uniref:CHASE3 domain-containing protein n=1 Tax=unclassified Nostoc TaxID=2593658 RepID=UPI002AD4777C|nr:MULTISPECIES: CHASE3 domain-containing protein [unclassified Nostoc]MDZ7989893.1 CHASE3 domain-containing protein [Nostoc sp. DedVER02]MDZ8114373.1 CHASE3 domain-containing protein [Nostoc sp. DedVER01b]